MITLSILSQKGGSGKTTIAINLAIAAELAGKSAVIIDLDPQASASSIGEIRKADTPAIMWIQVAQLEKVLGAARKEGADVVIIDTAPYTQHEALRAAKCADLIIMPCRPTILDIQAVSFTVELSKTAKVPLAMVLNAVPPTGRLGNEAIEALSRYRKKIAPTYIRHRAAFYHAMTAGLGVQEYEPNGKASAEIKQLYMFTMKYVKMLKAKRTKK